MVDLISLVLAVGATAGVARSVRLVGSGQRFEPQLYSCLGGLVLMAVAAWVALFLLRESFGMLRDQRLQPGASRWDIGKVAWRVLAATLLFAYFAAQSVVFKDAFHGTRVSPHAQGQLGLFPLCALMLMAGIGLGARPGRPGPQGSARPSRLRSLLVAVAIVGILAWYSKTETQLPYLILIALEAVRAAMRRGTLGGTALATRIEHGLPAALAGAVACFAAACWLSHSIRRSAAEARQEAILAKREAAAAVVILALASAMAWLLFRTVLMWDVWLYEGLWTVVGPLEIGALVLGYGGLAAGIAARAVTAKPEAPGATRPAPGATEVTHGRVARILVSGLRLSLIVAIGIVLLIREEPPRSLFRGLPAEFRGLANAVSSVYERALEPALLWRELDHKALYLVVGLAWVVVLLAGVLLREQSAPFDRVIERPASLIRCAAFTIGFTATCLCAMPTLFVGCLLAFHRWLNPLG
jgi:hypothetical protein